MAFTQQPPTEEHMRECWVSEDGKIILSVLNYLAGQLRIHVELFRYGTYDLFMNGKGPSSDIVAEM